MMHIDHAKLVELLAEASGIEKEKAEKQLADLVAEINGAIRDGDAYEIEGFGVFSGIGENMIFIPEESLATEINYKYVGMEPIEMEPAKEEEEPAQDNEEAPFAGLLDDINEEDEVGESEFGPIFKLDLDEDEEDETPETGEEEAPWQPEEKSGPDEWGIDSYKDEGDEKRFSELIGDQPEAADESEPGNGEDEPAEDDLSELFGDTEEQEDTEEFVEELSIQLSGKDEDEGSEDEDSGENLPDRLAEEGQEETKDEEPEPETDEEEEPDDPFEELANEKDEDEEEEPEDDDLSELFGETEEQQEVVPVIKNLSTEGQGKSRQKAKKPGLSPKPTAPRERKQSPAILWVLLIIVLVGGVVFGLGYFRVLNIPGITPEIASTQNQPPATSSVPPTAEEQQTTDEEAAEEPAEETNRQETPAEDEPPPTSGDAGTSPEQTSREQVSQVPDGQPAYGLRGVPDPAANNGYTIVVYSLRQEANALEREEELSRQGFRVLLASVPSSQYGMLWRVSLGQFESLREAAIAAETLEQPFSEHYFITKIQ